MREGEMLNLDVNGLELDPGIAARLIASGHIIVGPGSSVALCPILNWSLSEIQTLLCSLFGVADE
jgi:hypothetical protein